MEKIKEFFIRYIKKYYLVYIIFAVFLTIDLVTKAVFTNKNISVIKGVLSFVYTENTGGAFSMLSSKTWFLILASTIFLILIITVEKFYKTDSKLFIVGYSLIITGAIGNLIDRVILGYVRDFIKLDFMDFSRFNTVFNVADICVTFGVVIMIIHFIISLTKEKKSEK